MKKIIIFTAIIACVGCNRQKDSNVTTDSTSITTPAAPPPGSTPAPPRPDTSVYPRPDTVLH